MKKKIQQKKPSADLRNALADVEGLGQGRVVQKDSAIIFRVSVAEKEQIREIADRLGLSVSAYLLDLHRIARERLES